MKFPHVNKIRPQFQSIMGGKNKEPLNYHTRHQESKKQVFITTIAGHNERLLHKAISSPDYTILGPNKAKSSFNICTINIRPHKLSE